MRNEKMLQYQATETLMGLNEILNNPARTGFLGWEQETKLRETVKILDEIVTELKKQDKDLKA